MADRQLIYTLEQLTTVDMLQTQQNYYIALARFMQEIVNPNALGGFLCTPTVVPSLNVDIGNGEIYVTEPTDTTDYGVSPNDIPADATPILKQGIYNGGSFSTPAPVTVGDSINYLIQITFQEIDDELQPRLFKVGGTVNVNTIRQDLAIVQIKAGTPAPTGTQVTPTPDAGFIGAWVITVAYGQTTVMSGDISQYTGAPFFGSAYGGAIQDMITQTQADAQFLKSPANGGATPYEVFGNPSTGVAGVGTIAITSTSDPQGWWDNGTYTYKPTIPCTAMFFLGMDFSSASTQLIAIGADSISYSASGNVNLGETLSLSLSGAKKFNGTTDSLKFDLNPSSGSVTITGGQLSILVLVN